MHAHSNARCYACNDPAPPGWSFCVKCHSWSDLYYGLQEDGDPFRLGRALSYFRSRRPSEPLESLVAKLMRRLAIIENDMNYAVDERTAFNYAVDERMGCVETQVVHAIRPTVQIEECPVFEPEIVNEAAR